MIGTIRKRLMRDESGVAAIEFAVVAPIMLTLMMGLAELSYQSYLQAALSGAVQKAARDSTIEGNGTDASTAVIDGKVKTAVAMVINPVVWDASSRQNISHFADIGPEYFWDTNKNGSYDLPECFVDTNGNGIWDADPTTSGQGGANAVTIYQMGFKYTRITPIFAFLGWSSTVHLVAKTILKNQPYKFQNVADDVKVCPKS